MIKPIRTLLLATLTLSQGAWATTLTLADNLALLATQMASPTTFEQTLPLPESDTHLLVRFDSPRDPRSANESQGRITSSPLLLTLNGKERGQLRLSTPPLDTPQAVRDFARTPRLLLQDEQGQPVPFTLRPLKGGTLFTDYQALLAAELAPQPSWSARPAAPVTASQLPAGALNQEQADKLLRTLYQQADGERRKSFMRWALDL